MMPTAAVSDPFTLEPADPAAMMAEPSEDAPWGINPNTGKPYTMSPEARHARGQALAAGRAAARASGKLPPRKKTARQATGKTPATQGVDYRPAVAGMLQMVAMPLAILGRWWPAFTLDSYALAKAAPALAEAGHDLLVSKPAWAASVERVGQMSPWMNVAAVALPVVVQLAANHRLIRVEDTPEAGFVTPETLAAELERAAESVEP